ncbi:copper chaperone CopZ [Chitinophaga terrae (ex Kim and Jung 2007)]|jgi:copper chaperone CopZ|uniref:heavy-metal-associated domain-containing protein n=1 Tax=Chitinophaga terrae (ex Kim and Jung 2007) TaxID=408074 RepID=UPI0027818A7B|nr:heavy-metal-associated domain-containing protein [Chitinophaga terrae (ex Kim and Jung 2007)]MDQ0109204.1 copper chaperone CopZ [Chitinophaga terrae (ex Kim and Jung 2007)]
MEAKFKTNIKCSGCIATVTPVLNELVGPDNWQVDLQSPDKILTVKKVEDKSEVRNAVEKAGFKAIDIA